MESCVCEILSFLKEPVIRQGAYVFQYKNQVQLLEQENRRLGAKRERIQGMVDIEKNCGKVIITEVSNWLKEVEQVEGEIANFLHQPENGESFECFPGRMCPNLMWRHKRGMEAHKRKSDVSELIRRGERLESLSVALDASFQSELVLDSSQYYTAFESRASVFAEIMNALNDSGVDMIGVHGPGGTGKTTMVKEVAKEAKERGIFDKSAMAVVSKDPNTSKLQEDLMIQLNLKCAETSEKGRAAALGNALLNGDRKILVILDDLWQVLNLQAIGIPISGLGAKGSKIILTSRSGEVLKGMNFGRSVFSIGYLKEQEAWELFKKVTGDVGVDELTARKVCKKCADLPIAIVAVGVALKGEEGVEWRNALLELEKSRLKYIEGVELVGYTPLKLSYDFLKDEGAKSCFLLCCLFPEDAVISIDDLVKYSFALGFLGRQVDTLEDARGKVGSMVHKLKKSCLLLNGKHVNYVRMHDVIRDLAISITEERQTEHGGGHDWPGKQQFIVDHDIRKWPNNDAWKHHTAISFRINDVNFPFPSGVLDCPLVHTLVLKPRKYPPLKIPKDFFQGTEQARVLDLQNVSLELPSSIFELDHLRMLLLSGCKFLGDLTTILNLKKSIEILSFEGCNIKELPQEIGELTRLRSLNLRWCERLKVIPKGVISNLILLEDLYVTWCFTGWDSTVDGEGMSNVSIGELKSLTQLTDLEVSIETKSVRIIVQECPHLFEKLINFKIYINALRYELLAEPLLILKDPIWSGLVIRDIPRIDEFHILMGKVNALTLEKIPRLEGAFKDLKDLNIHGFTLSGGGYFSKLTRLEISKCNSMKYLFSPSCARALQQLQKVSVRDCSNMEQIIGVVDHHHEEEVIIFSRLRELRLNGLPQFRSFYPIMEKTTIERNLSNCNTAAEYIFDEKVFFPVLKDLNIQGLPVKDIWNKQAIQSSERSNKASFSQLSMVYVSGCDNLVNVFPSNMLSQLQNLTGLRVSNCLQMEVIVSKAKGEGETDDGTIKFSELKRLELYDLPNLRSFYESKSEAPPLFNYQDVCPNVKILHLRDLKSSRELQLWDFVTTQEHLRSVRLIGCQVSTNVLSHHVRGSIEDMRLFNCQGFKHVIDFDGTSNIGEEEFVDVEYLSLYGLPELVSMWNENLHKIGSLRSLKYINIKNCPQMKSLLTHSMAMTLQHLKTIVVESCVRMEEIIIIEENNINIAGKEKATCQIEFSKLKYLILIGLPNLKNFCNDARGSFSFASLRGVSVENCPKMKTFVSGQICLLPRMMRAVEGDENVEITDLNAYFEARNDGSNHMKKIIHWGDSFDKRELYETKDFVDYKDLEEIEKHIYPYAGGVGRFDESDGYESDGYEHYSDD